MKNMISRLKKINNMGNEELQPLYDEWLTYQNYYAL